MYVALSIFGAILYLAILCITFGFHFTFWRLSAYTQGDVEGCFVFSLFWPITVPCYWLWKFGAFLAKGKNG